MRNGMVQRLAVSTVAAAGLLVGLVGPAAASDVQPAAAPAAHVVVSDGVHAEAAKISRTKVIANAKTWLNNHKINYSGGTHKGANGKKYRKDCSGFVSMALELSSKNGGPNTEGLSKYVSKIKYSSLKAGDLIGLIGPGTSGPNGHVMLFVKWGNAKHTKAVVWEHGGGSGSHAYPHQDTHTVPVKDSRGKFYAYRAKKITG